MSASLHLILKKLKASHLFQVKRRLNNFDSTTGFVVAFSESLILFHNLDQNTFRLNGYTVLRDQDINQYRVLSKAEYWQFRAVQHFHLTPVTPTGISVVSLPELLKSIARSYSLITVHPEIKKPDICYIGSLASMAERTFTIEDLNSNGEWSGPRRIKFNDITRVDFGGGYEEALAVTAPKRQKTLK